jgi:hypothetical protein
MDLSGHERLMVPWAVLAGVTLVAWWIGAAHGTGPLRPDAAVAVSAIAITLFKVRLIMREFMGVKRAPMQLRLVTDGWLAVFGAAMLAAYFA